MSSRGQKGKAESGQSVLKKERRFHTLANPESIDFRLILALTIAWPLAQIPIVLQRGLPALEQLPALFASFVVGHGFFALLLILGRASLWRTRFMQNHHSLAILLLFLNSLVSSVVAYVVFSLLNPGSMLDVETVLLRFVVFAAIFSAVTQIREFRILVKDLEQKQAEHLGLIEQSKMQALAERELVHERLADVRAQVLEGAQLDTSVLVQRLRRISEEVIRPWSHNLAREIPQLRVPRVSWPWPKWPTVLNRAFTHRVIRPLPIASLITIFSLSYSIRVVRGEQGDFVVSEAGDGWQVAFDADSFTLFLVQISTIFLSTYFAAVLVSRLDALSWFRNRIPSAAIRAVFQLLLLTALAMFLLGILFGVIGGSQLTIPLLFLQAFPVLIIGALATLVAATRELKDSIIEELAKLNLELRRELAAQNQQLLLVRKELSNALHGPVRAALLSVVFALNQSASKDEQTRALLERLENPELLSPGSSSKDAMTLIDQTLELWRDSCQIVVGISVGAKDGLDASAPTASFLSQVLSESVTNAIAHGGAKQISIEISDKEGNIHLQVSDDGEFSETSTPGLGSQLMDSLTLNWSITTTDRGTLLTAVLPLKL